MDLKKPVKSNDSMKSSRLMKLKIKTIKGHGSSCDSLMILDEFEEGTLTH